MSEEQPNWTDRDAQAAIADSISRQIRNEWFRKHVRALIYNDLISDGANKRKATKKEAREAGAWAVEAMVAGKPVHKFKLKQKRRSELALLRRHLIPFTYAHLRGNADQIAKAQLLIKKSKRMSLKELAAALADYQPVWLNYHALLAAEDERALFDPDAFFSPSGNRWALIVSKAELGRVGIALNNCVAPKRAYHLIYARAMAAGAAALWALYTPANQCIGLASIDLRTKRLEQAKTFRNGAIADPRDVPALLSYLNLNLPARLAEPARPHFSDRDPAVEREQIRARERLINQIARTLAERRQTIAQDPTWPAAA